MIRALLLLAALGAPLAASAQTPPAPPSPPRIRDATPANSRPASPPSRRQVRFRFATNALRNGNIAEAIRVLEELVSEGPGDVAVASKLVDAYSSAGRVQDALDLVTQATVDPAEAAVQRGTLLAGAGRTDEALAEWDRAVALRPDAPLTYRRVADAMGEARFFAEAAAVLEQGRVALGEDDAFRLERANLYGYAGDFARAGQLYAGILSDDPTALRGVQGRLRAFLSGADAAQAFRVAFDDAIAAAPLNTALREQAAWLATERDDYAAAIDLVRAVDRLDGGDGSKIIELARTARAAGAFDAAERALDDVLDRHGDAPPARAALLERAQLALLRSRDGAERAGLPTPHGDAARRTLAEYLATPVGDPAAMTQAALDLGTLERDLYRRYDTADSLFVIAARSRDAAVAGRALLARGEVAVGRGDLYDARDRYSEVEEQLRIGPLAEQARYELARLDVYEGFPLSALARVEALDNNTAAEVTNDAIALGVTLRESLAGASTDTLHTHLDAYGQAELAHRRGMHSRALVLLDSLDAADPGHVLGDEQLFLRALALRALGESAAAIETLGSLAQRFRTSFFLDRALRLSAVIQERDLFDTAAARETWDRLLEQHPGSLYAPEARENLERLRTSM